MIATFSPPLSGAILGLVVDVLDLRRWDRHRALASRNARRYLSGERVGAEAEMQVQRAIAEAVVASELVPATLRLSDVFPKVPAEIDHVPATAVVQVLVGQSAKTWDGLAGALHRCTAPVAFPRHAAGACLRLIAIDLAVRTTALLWLMGEVEERPVPDFWTTPDGIGKWLRTMVAASGQTRDGLAKTLSVPPNTLDGWLDEGVKPSFQNMEGLARAFSGRGVGDRITLLRRLRLAFAARDIFGQIEAAIGHPQALGICQRVAFYANEMSTFPRRSTKPREETDAKMRIALTVGAIGAERIQAKWICSMVNHLRRHEQNPVWRTSLRAVTGSWLEHLQLVLAKLGSVDEEALGAVLGRMPTRDDLDVLAYQVQASKEEEAQDPSVAHALLREAMEDGERGAVELTLHAVEASDRRAPLEAIELLRLAVQKDPTSAGTHFRLGCELWQIGDVAAGLAELEIAAQLDPAWDRPKVEIAIVLLNEGRNDAALTKLILANLECPSNPWVLLHLGYANERLGQVSAAISAYEELIAIHVTHAEALDRVAHLHFVMGDKRAGADRAKRAAHLGVGTVFAAWENGYYDKGTPAERPVHTNQDESLHFPDSAWKRSRS